MGKILDLPRLYPRLSFPTSFIPLGNDLSQIFTPKEKNILDGIVRGDTNQQIAVKLKTTRQVITNYLRVIFDKAGVDSRLELALWWLHHGYMSPWPAPVNTALKSRTAAAGAAE